MKNTAGLVAMKLSVADRRRLSSGCVLITLKTEKTPAFSLSKGK